MARTRTDVTDDEGIDLSDMPELTKEQWSRALSAEVRDRIARGDIREGAEIRDFRRFTWLTQVQFAKALGISVHTLRNWEQGRRRPEGPALALLRVAARHPRVLRENLEGA